MDSPLTDPLRLAALDATGLMDPAAVEEFDRLARIASSALGCPVSLVSLVDDSRQCFPGASGLPPEVDGDRQTPLSHSFCKHVVANNEIFIVEDAVQHPLVKDNPSITELGVAAYAGVPIRLPDGGVLGSFCAIDNQPRRWRESEIDVLRDLSLVATDLIRSRARLAELAEANDKITEGGYRLKQILDSTGEGIYGIDAQGICTFVNRKAIELLEFDNASEVLGKNMHDLIQHSHEGGEKYPIEECKIISAIDSNEGIHADDEVYWKKGGESLPVDYRSYPVLDGGPTRAVITFVDMTNELHRRRQLEDARDSAVRANQQKSRFLANMSHEIRTPMNAILGFSELLEDIVSNPKGLSYVQAIRSSGQSLLDLINDILDLSKIESGKLELNPTPISVRAMVASVRLLFAQQAAEQNLNFVVEVGDECPDFLVVDDLRVRQLLLNLISNALKFTQKGSIDVLLVAEKDPLDAQKVTLAMRVSDTGVGISEADQKLIFLPFRQVGSHDSLGGTGLGLSICRRLTELMAGEISVESEEGQGSTFWIRIPQVQVAKEAAGIDTGSAAPVNFDLLKESRILVVDDNEFNRELAMGYLESSHHTVAQAVDGKEGVAKVRNWKPDVVLMDIRMPVMDGKEARRIIKADPELKKIPVLAVTASSLLHHTRELRRDFDGYMRKPFSRTQLFRALAKVLPSLEESVVEEAITTLEEEAVDAGEVDRSRWKGLFETMRVWGEERVPQMQRSMVIGEISEFSMELESLAEKARCEPVASYAATLREQAALFELSKLEVTLASFDDLNEQLNEFENDE